MEHRNVKAKARNEDSELESKETEDVLKHMEK
jgi:hypothetical protein